MNHSSSMECTKSELDLFGVPPTQTSIEKGEWVEYYPITSVTETGPIQFSVVGNSDYYLDLSQSYLHIIAKIEKKGGAWEDEDNAGPVNLFLHSLFSQVDVSLNDRLVTPSSNTYPYRAMIETLLNYGHDSKNTKLTSSLFYKDSAGHMDSLTTNTGLKTRSRFTAKGAQVDMIGRLHCDLFMQPRLLLNMVDMKIRLIRSIDVFSLMATEDKYKIKVEEAILIIRKELPSPAVRLGHTKALEHGTAKYPVNRVICKSYATAPGSLTFSQDNIFLGQLPNRIVIGLVESDNFNGNITKNPFNFHHHDVNFLALYMDGQQFPHKALTPNYENKKFIRCYHTLFSGTGKESGDLGNWISREEYSEGHCLYVFDLTPDGCSIDHFNVRKNGNLRMEVHFAKPAQKPLNIIIYAEFENIIEIDKKRNVIFDFTQ